jgi:hypothetical protein
MRQAGIPASSRWKKRKSARLMTNHSKGDEL